MFRLIIVLSIPDVPVVSLNGSCRRQVLSKTVDIDKLLSQLVQTPRHSTPRTARQALQAIIDLKQTLEQVNQTLSSLQNQV